MKGDTISVHYTGTFEDGRVFDSSRERNKPFSFQIGNNQVIRCWEEGFLHLAKMQRGSFRCPPEYAYGSSGAGSIIPPDTVLNFNVELLEINPTPTMKDRVSEAGDQLSKKSGKKRRRRSIWDLPPVGDAREHMCFSNTTVVASLGLFASSAVFLIYACMKKVQPLSKERRREIKAALAK